MAPPEDIGHVPRQTGETSGQEGTASTTAAVGLCLDSPTAWSMTPLQLAVFQQVCFLQMADAGPHSLLPNVMEGFLWLARRPWWDAGVAGIVDEEP